MAKTRQIQPVCQTWREFGCQRPPQGRFKDQRTSIAVYPEEEKNRSALSEVTWLKRKAKKILLWKRIENFLTERLLLSTTNPTADYIVGLTLHCFILSVFVLSVATIKILINIFKFACYITLHYAIYRGDITPITENSTEPVTVEQLREATIFDQVGLKIVIVHNKSPRPHCSSRTSATILRLRDSGSDSSQDVSNIMTFSA